MKVILLYHDNHRDSGLLSQVAKSEDSILDVMKNDEYFLYNVVSIKNVDYVNEEITYTYIDFDGVFEEGKICFEVLEVI